MALLELSDLKDHLEITDSSEDSKLQDIVDSIDPYVKGYLQRDIEETTYTSELYDGPGQSELVLKNYPIISVSSVIIYTTSYDSVTLEERSDGTDGYFIKDSESGILCRINLWPRGRGIIEVTYTAGYSTIPSDITLACKLIGEYFYTMDGTAGIRSESLGSYSYSLASGIGDMYGDIGIPDVRIKALLSRYRRKVVIGGY